MITLETQATMITLETQAIRTQLTHAADWPRYPANRGIDVVTHDSYQARAVFAIEYNAAVTLRDRNAVNSILWPQE
jgi:hypothetical protein